MKINSKREQRNYIIIGLCAILVIMGVGYAAFSQLLTINGTANISNSWCVGFDNTKTNTYTPKAGITGATVPTGSMSYSGTACESTLQPASSLTAHFYQPGDEIEYTLTIVNKSSVTAAIKSILVDNESVTSNTTKTKNNITYIVNMPESTTLAPNASTTMTVIARFQNETNVTGNVNGQTETIEVKINTEQDDGTGGMDIKPVSNKYTGTIYRWSTTQAKNRDSIVAGSEIKWCLVGTVQGQSYNSCDGANYYIDSQSECEAEISNAISDGYIQEGEVSCEQKTVSFEGIGEYTTDASTLNKDYYLKHDVVDNIITASYACFVTDTEHCMQGGNSSYYAANKTLLQSQESWFTGQSGNCYFYPNLTICGSSAWYANADDGGEVSVGVSNSIHCDVNVSGISGCTVSSSGDEPVVPADPVIPN